MVQTELYHYHLVSGETLAISLSYCLSYSCMEGQQWPLTFFCLARTQQVKTIPPSCSSTTTSTSTSICLCCLHLLSEKAALFPSLPLTEFIFIVSNTFARQFLRLFHCVALAITITITDAPGYCWNLSMKPFLLIFCLH